MLLLERVASAMILTLNIAEVIEDSELNLMLAIHLNEFRDVDRWTRRTNLVRKNCLGRIIGQCSTGRLVETLRTPQICILARRSSLGLAGRWPALA